MDAEQQQVREFMLKAGQHCPFSPEMPASDVRRLRFDLIQEELDELADAFQLQDINMAYDAILDLLVVVIGTANAMGLDIEPGWQEVIRTNMDKFAPGAWKREDGKWMKPPDWQPPNLKSIIEEQSK